MSTTEVVDIVQRLATPLAWPFVAVIAIMVLRRHVVSLALGVARLHELVGRGGELAGLSDKLTQMRTDASDLKQMLETVSIRGQSVELERLAEQQPIQENGQPALSIDDMFSEMEEAWQQVKSIIQLKAKAAGVSPYLMGTKGVSNTLKEVVDKNAITQRSAALAVALSAQYQRFYRTTSPREEWLTQQIYRSFLDAAEETKKALERRVLS